MASNHQVETTTLSAKCHCESTHITITIPTSALPLKTHLCHCHICRRVHGTLCCFHAPLPAGVVPILSPPLAFTRYIHSPLAASARLFCSTCGCHIGDEDLESPSDSLGGVPEWRIATSLFPSSAFTLGSHIYPPLSHPSLATWIPDIPSWTPAKDDPMFPIPPPVAPDPDSEPEGGQLLRAECMCGGVIFPVRRPSDSASGTDRQLFKGRAARLDAAVGRDKWVAQLDVSDDMRLTTGANLMAWMTVPTPFGFADGLGFDGRGDSTVKVYQVLGSGGKGQRFKKWAEESGNGIEGLDFGRAETVG
ncbi:hypothetical protein B0T18DRAFT_491946 [Schizothecium vesticola]|uniref:CENP-V/GFA domain-containing protein n=1 Tax=Schizothecium vesticola TaxID=314040 RepID=A0AA40BP42_9PEZI|nr:hypothetical protein B0T18DRAFT_491946 [Schizothecium vesticola]